MNRFGSRLGGLFGAVILGVLVFSIASAQAAGPPIITLEKPTDFTLTTVTLHGKVDSNGPAATKWHIEYGKTTSYGLNTKETSQTGVFTFTEPLVGLEPANTYHYRVVATNSYGTTYSEDSKLEMSLQWKIQGKPITGTTYYRAYANPNEMAGGGTVTISNPAVWIGWNQTAAVEVSCLERNPEHPNESGYGVLNGEYHIATTECKTFVNGSHVVACDPSVQPKFDATGTLVLNTGLTLKLGKEESCSIGEAFDVYYKGAGFRTGASAKEEVYLPITLTVPGVNGWTVKDSTKWTQFGGGFGDLPFGIS